MSVCTGTLNEEDPLPSAAQGREDVHTDTLDPGRAWASLEDPGWESEETGGACDCWPDFLLSFSDTEVARSGNQAARPFMN